MHNYKHLLSQFTYINILVFSGKINIPTQFMNKIIIWDLNWPVALLECLDLNRVMTAQFFELGSCSCQQILFAATLLFSWICSSLDHFYFILFDVGHFFLWFFYITLFRNLLVIRSFLFQLIKC